MTHDGLAAHAGDLLDANLYLTLGTVDADGHPWTSPVYFAAAGDRGTAWDFYWASEVDARHSRNIAARPQVSLVVFDSTVPAYHGRAVYAVGEAHELSGGDIDRGLAVYPGREGRGGTPLVRDDVVAPSAYRLYRVTAAEVWVLCPREPGEPCPLHGVARDHRARVTPPEDAAPPGSG